MSRTVRMEYLSRGRGKKLIIYFSTLSRLAAQAASNPTDWFSVVREGGALAVLLIGSYLFLSGRLISGKIARQQTEAAVRASRLAFQVELAAAIKDAVKAGFTEAWYDIHTSHQEAVELQARAIVKAMKEIPTRPLKGDKPKE